jgi:hypothetical protein
LHHQVIIKTKIMKVAILAACVVMGAFMSCKKKEKFATIPAAQVTTYTGNLAYTGATGEIVANELTGKATITGSSAGYTITFSDNVPSVSGLKFSGKDGSYATVAEDGSVSGISIGSNNISIGFVKGGSNWAFTGTR